MIVKVSDYIVEFFADKGITDVFGYPGGMVTHLMDSFSRKREITAHVNYHEQAAAFAACGYAQASGSAGVAYATSGPGATNLITGICNAYFDSIPTIFLTGQVNTFEAKGTLRVRQKGFQETDILSMVRDVTKFSSYVEKPERIRFYLEKAWETAHQGRPGPVLLDIPMNVMRAMVVREELDAYVIGVSESDLSAQHEKLDMFIDYLKDAQRPVAILGAGVKLANVEQELIDILNAWGVPIVSSMLAFGSGSSKSRNFYGFIGAYGLRTANFIVAKSDLVLTLGTRLDVRQVGGERNKFAENAKLFRVDIDQGELENYVREDEIGINLDLRDVTKYCKLRKFNVDKQRFKVWNAICGEIKRELTGFDEKLPNKIIRSLSNSIPDNVIITTDVGQNQVWIAQSFEVKNGQRVLFSGGHGAMGYSLPAAIGAYYGSGKKPVISFSGDGGFQMNMQELQFIVRENIPITIVVLNNHSLGMIRHFQEMYFEGNYYQTKSAGGYTVPDLKKIAIAYGINYERICCLDDSNSLILNFNQPNMIEIQLDDNTYVLPKLEFGKPNQDQEPLLNRELYARLMGM